MWIEQPPLLFRMLFPECVWRIHRKKKTVFLTFDDGPNRTVTPWVLDVLERYGVAATFFMVGDNVARAPEMLEEVRRRGHSYGNHTMNHLNGLKFSRNHYIENVNRAHELIQSSLMRPPYGVLRHAQAKNLRSRFNIIMYDVVTRDYNKKLSGQAVLNNVKRYAREGSIIVFHDSEKAQKNLEYALPRAIEWLQENGFSFEAIPML